MTTAGRAQAPRAQTARLLVLGLLLLNVPSALLLAASQVRWVAGAPAVGVALLMIGYAVLQTLVLHAAVTPWVGEARKRLVGFGLVATTVTLAAPLTLAAEPGGAPWAWAAGFAVGALVVLHPAGRGAVLAAVTVLAGGAVSVLLDGDLRDLAVYTSVTGVAAAGMGVLTAWLLRVLMDGETGRDARTALAVTQERLRLTRELHDVLAQNLTVIALKAEMAADLATDDPPGSVAQAREIRTLAETSLHQTRTVLRGQDPLDLDGQLRTAVQVLTSAGIATDVDVVPVGAAEVARYLAAVIREGTTNVLRHSDATACSITVAHGPEGIMLSMVNDRAYPPPGPTGAAGTGLRGLAERGIPLGAHLSSGLRGDGHVLRVEVPGAWA